MDGSYASGFCRMGGKALETFYLRVISLTEIAELERLKEELKDRVVDPQLNWQNRMELYQKVQLVMQRIECLQGTNNNV